MRFSTVAAAVIPLAGQALASLNCTMIAEVVTAYNCEWEGCEARGTHEVNEVLHAGCRADCSTEEE